MRRVLVLLVFALPLLAADSVSEKQRLERVAAEVQRRTQLRKEVAAAEENARRLLRDHESGKAKVSESELAAAQARVREADAHRAKVKAAPPRDKDSIELRLPGADMQTVASAWKVLFGTQVTINERAKSKSVWITFPAVPREEARAKFVAGLKDHGIYVVTTPEGIVLDTEPAAKKSP